MFFYLKKTLSHGKDTLLPFLGDHRKLRRGRVDPLPGGGHDAVLRRRVLPKEVLQVVPEERITIFFAGFSLKY